MRETVARGGHSYSTRRTVRDRGQDAVKRSSRIFSTGQAVKRTFWVGQRSRPTFAQTNSYSTSWLHARFCLHCLSQQVDLTVTGACARPNWADFSPVLEPDTVIHHVWPLNARYSKMCARANSRKRGRGWDKNRTMQRGVARVRKKGCIVYCVRVFAPALAHRTMRSTIQACGSPWTLC